MNSNEEINRHKVFDSGLKKEDTPKIRFDLIPFEVLERVAKQFTYGMNKYGYENWKKGTGDEINIFREAALRHTIKWAHGIEDGDEHGIAAITNIIMWEWLHNNKRK